MKSAFCVLIMAVLCSPLRGGAGEAKKDGAALFARARKVSSITENSSPPFHMKISFKLLGMRGGPLKGTYQLWWESPEKSAAEITAPGYSERIIWTGSSRFEARPSAYPPLRIWQLQRLIETILRIRAPREPNLKVHEKKVDGRAADCVEVHRIGDSKAGDSCFEQQSGALVEFGNEGYSLKYSQYGDFGGKLFPQSMRLVDGARTAVEARVENLESGARMDDASFAVPPNAQLWATCDDPQPGALERKVAPMYPAEARQAREQGTVVLLITIAEDGTIRNPVVVQSAGRALDGATLQAVRNWKYRPTTCGGLPIRIQTDIRVNYELRW